MVSNETGQEDPRVVLLVEDEESHALLVRRLFEEDGPSWVIHHVTSIGDAKKWLVESSGIDKLSIVISDYRLPDGNGLDMAAGANSPEEVGFPLIILTGMGSEKLAVQSLRSGAMDYVVKVSEDLQKLPQTARRVLIEWDAIVESSRAEADLKSYIRDLEQANCNLEEFVDHVAKDLETAMASIATFNDLLLEKYSDKLDDTAQEYLYKSKMASERANTIIDGLFEFLVPVYFDSSLIKLYSAKIDQIRRAGKADKSDDV